MRTIKTLLGLIVVFLMSSSVLGVVAGPDIARACPNPPTSCLTDVNGGGQTDLVFYFFHPQQGLTVRTKLSNGDGTWTAVQAILGDGTLSGPLAAHDSGILYIDRDGEALPPGPDSVTLNLRPRCPGSQCTIFNGSMYQITLDRFQIYNTMSFHEDTVYVYFDVKVGDTVYTRSAKIGDRNNGTYSLGWAYTVAIPEEDINNPVLVTYRIVNNGNDDAKTQIEAQTAITVGIADGLRQITTAFPTVSAVIASIELHLIKVGAARWLLNNLVNCDGTVLSEAIVTNGSMLRDLTSGGTYTAEPRYIIDTSKFGCRTADYSVTFSVKRW